MNKKELEKIKQKALEEHIPIIMDDTLEVVDKILKEVKPKRILEIGTAVGYSAMCFSEYLEDGGIIDTIERDEERIAEAKINIKNVGLEDKINIYEGDAVEILPTLNEQYDVAFIDAAKGKYPFFLQQRILSDKGHLSNKDCSRYLSTLIGDKTKYIVLAHLSEENNTPELASLELDKMLEKSNVKINKTYIAKQDESLETIEV